MFLLLLLACMPMLMWAQYGLKISLEADSVLLLKSYTGLDVVVMDTLEREADGSFIYEPILPTGMYVVESCVDTTRKKEAVNVEFLSVEKPIVMVLDGFDGDYSVRFESSPENTRWMAYQSLRDRYFHGEMGLEEARRQVDSLSAGADDYASRLIRADANPELQAAEFQDPTLIPTNVLTTKIVNYLERSSGDFVAGCDHILGLAKGDMNGYEFALLYLLKGFTAMGLSEVTDHLLNFPQLAEGEITEAEGLRLQQLTEPYQKVRVGAKAPNCHGVTIDGKPYDLYESKAERILVVFWSVDCEYCHDFLVQIRKHLDLQKDYELVTFALGEDEREVKRELKKLRLRGYHFFDEARWDGKAFLDYHIVSTPTVFLLDQEKTIVCKPYDWEELSLEVRSRKSEVRIK